MSKWFHFYTNSQPVLIDGEGISLINNIVASRYRELLNKDTKKVEEVVAGIDISVADGSKD